MQKTTWQNGRAAATLVPSGVTHAKSTAHNLRSGVTLKHGNLVRSVTTLSQNHKAFELHLNIFRCVNNDRKTRHTQTSGQTSVQALLSRVNFKI